MCHSCCVASLAETRKEDLLLKKEKGLSRCSIPVRAPHLECLLLLLFHYGYCDYQTNGFNPVGYSFNKGHFIEKTWQPVWTWSSFRKCVERRILCTCRWLEVSLFFLEGNEPSVDHIKWLNASQLWWHWRHLTPTTRRNSSNNANSCLKLQFALECRPPNTNARLILIRKTWNDVSNGSRKNFPWWHFSVEPHIRRGPPFVLNVICWFFIQSLQNTMASKRNQLKSIKWNEKNRFLFAREMTWACRNWQMSFPTVCKVKLENYQSSKLYRLWSMNWPLYRMFIHTWCFTFVRTVFRLWSAP